MKLEVREERDGLEYWWKVYRANDGGRIWIDFRTDWGAWGPAAELDDEQIEWSPESGPEAVTRVTELAGALARTVIEDFRADVLKVGRSKALRLLQERRREAFERMEGVS